METIVIHLTFDNGSDVEISMYDSKGRLVKRVLSPSRSFIDLRSYCESFLISRYVHRPGGLIVIQCVQGADA